MANNDRVTKSRSDTTIPPSWAEDEKALNPANVTVTKSVNGDTYWNQAEETRTLLTKNAFNKAGWRSKRVIPEGEAVILYDTTLFEVYIADTKTPVENDGTVEIGTPLEVILKNPGYQIGCKARVVNGTSRNNIWLQNWISPNGSQEPNLIRVQVLGNVEVTGETKRRGFLNIHSTVANGNKIQVKLSTTSWADKYQETSISLGLQPNELANFEAYVGDSVLLDIQVDNGYDWCNFQEGYSGSMSLVNSANIGYNSSNNGGTYSVLLTEDTKVITMDAIRPITLYLNQPHSNKYDKCAVKVLEAPFTGTIYRKGISIGTVGKTIVYGKNGSKPSNTTHLYAGTKLEVYSTRLGGDKRYVASGAVLSTTTTTPVPSVPQTPSYNSTFAVTLGAECEANGYCAIGLYWFGTEEIGTSIHTGWSTSFGNSELTEMTWTQFRNNFDSNPQTWWNTYLPTLKTGTISLQHEYPMWFAGSFEYSYNHYGTFDGESIDNGHSGVVDVVDSNENLIIGQDDPWNWGLFDNVKVLAQLVSFDGTKPLEGKFTYEFAYQAINFKVYDDNHSNVIWQIRNEWEFAPRFNLVREEA